MLGFWVAWKGPFYSWYWPAGGKEYFEAEIDDDTETLDNFYNDVVDMVSKKGVLTEKETDKFTLFDDAPEYT